MHSCHSCRVAVISLLSAKVVLSPGEWLFLWQHIREINRRHCLKHAEFKLGRKDRRFMLDCKRILLTYISQLLDRLYTALQIQIHP